MPTRPEKNHMNPDSPIFGYPAIHKVGYWLVVSTYPSEKYDFVSWDDEIPNINGKIKFMFQTTNQVSIDPHFTSKFS